MEVLKDCHGVQLRMLCGSADRWGSARLLFISQRYSNANTINAAHECSMWVVPFDCCPDPEIAGSISSIKDVNFGQIIS